MTPSERQRHYRARRRAGLAVLRIRVPEVKLAAMLEGLRKVDRAGADDLAALTAAVERLIADLIAAWERDA